MLRVSYTAEYRMAWIVLQLRPKAATGQTAVTLLVVENQSIDALRPNEARAGSRHGQGQPAAPAFRKKGTGRTQCGSGTGHCRAAVVWDLDSLEQGSRGEAYNFK